jgi:hypothetical protein
MGFGGISTRISTITNWETLGHSIDLSEFDEGVVNSPREDLRLETGLKFKTPSKRFSNL